MTSEPQGAIMELRARIETLPIRRRAAGRVDALAKYSTLVGAAADAVAELREVRKCIELVFPDAPLEASGRWLETARTRAGRLLSEFTTADEVERPAVEGGLAELKRAVQTAKQHIRTEWRQLIESVVDRYLRLVNALHEAGVHGSGPLRAAVERVQRMERPPATRSAATQAAEDIASVAAAVRALGLEGPVGAFLTAAADRRASAGSLRDPEIVAFLDRHDLWSVLLVGLS